MSSIEKLLLLAKKTGDRLIVHDSAKDISFVILDIDAYNNLLDAQQDWNHLEQVISNKKNNTTTSTNHPFIPQEFDPNEIYSEPIEEIEDINDDISYNEQDFYSNEKKIDVLLDQDQQKYNKVNNTSQTSETKLDAISQIRNQFEQQKNDQLVDTTKKSISSNTNDKSSIENLNTDWFSAGNILKNRYGEGNGAHKDEYKNHYKKKVVKKTFYNPVHLEVGGESVFFEEPL